MANKEEQLQDILNKCIGKWWKPNLRSTLKDEPIVSIEVREDRVWFGSEKWIEIGIRIDLSYHDLFSKDSWLIDFMKWQEWDNARRTDIRPYRDMWPMTSEEKIDYILENVAL